MRRYNVYQRGKLKAKNLTLEQVKKKVESLTGRGVISVRAVDIDK